MARIDFACYPNRLEIYYLKIALRDIIIIIIVVFSIATTHNTNQKTNPPPKFIKKYNTSDEAMLNVRHEIQSEELFNKLDKSCTADINLNYEMLNDDILRAKHKHMRCN